MISWFNTVFLYLSYTTDLELRNISPLTSPWYNNIAKVQLHDTVCSIQIPEALSVFLVAAGPEPGVSATFKFRYGSLKSKVSFIIFLTPIWWLDTLKRIEKIIRESAFEQKKGKPRLKFNPGLALIVLRTTAGALCKYPTGCLLPNSYK